MNPANKNAGPFIPKLWHSPAECFKKQMPLGVIDQLPPCNEWDDLTMRHEPTSLNTSLICKSCT